MPDTGEVPTPDGWSRVVVQRTTGATAGKFDVYYFSPIGKKLRSRNEVRTHCERNNLEVDMSLIFFSQRTSTTGVRIARSGTTTPKTASPKTTKSAKVPKAQKTPKSPKTPKSETTRKRKVASKTEGKSRRKAAFKAKAKASIKSCPKTSSKDSGTMRVKFVFRGKRAAKFSANGGPSAKKSRR
ncbi:methyl-CpG-binding protein 2-like isoform X1 [Homarus americanus]|uniref:methyl-CpG-binding protein 2-like isoform X1 n=1 Tax=Homarus americanus TaxID=6706 RepID=UPI001C46798A|nr:methyl-CpG-binding protein 2-like isoform X1 [Homarus americanus]